MKVEAVAVLALLALAACGGKAATSSARSTATQLATSATVSHTPTPTPTPTPTVWSQHAAAHQYLVLVKPVNTLLAQWNNESDGGPVQHDVDIAAKLAKAEDVFARGLAAGQWPANTRSAVAQLQAYILKARIGWQAVSRSTTMQEVYDTSNAPVLNDPAAAAAATGLRIALGLPSN